VSFDEAKSCFFDPIHIVIDDSEHSSDDEHRQILIGMSNKARHVVVMHIEFEKDELIRIFSARKATKKERAQYEDL
jgi:uncharacterized protein